MLFLSVILVSGGCLVRPDGYPRYSLIGPGGYSRCSLITRTPALIRSSRTIVRNVSRTLVSRLSSVSYLINASSYSRVSDATILPSASDCSGSFRSVLINPSNCSFTGKPSKFTVTAPRQRSGYSYSDELLHFLRRYDPTFVRVDLQQTQKESEEPRTVCLGTLPANPLRIPLFFHRTERRKGHALHTVCQLAATIIRRKKK